MKINKIFKPYSILIIALMGISNFAIAQQVFDSLYSDILNEQRSLEIIYPEGYDAKEKYDVIYVLDGEWNAQYTADMQQDIVRWGFMPNNIIVGVRNTYIDGVNQRSRDMTPTQSEPGSNDGEATAFVSFLKNELLPYINEKYPTTGDNTLFGHSHGGTATMFTFLTEPQLFKSYIAADPSLWWDNRYMSKLASERLPKMQDVVASLHISGRLGGDYDGMGITTMDSVLTALKPKGLIWESDAYKNEVHNSVKHKGLYDGLKLSYRGHSTGPMQFHPENGIVLKDKPTPIFMMENPANVYYTLDGSEPNKESLPMQQFIRITGKTTMKAQKFGHRSSNKATVGQFVEGNLEKPLQNEQGLTKGGMMYTVYQNNNEIESGTTVGGFNFPKKLENNNTVVFEGFFKAEKEGAHIFAVEKAGIGVKMEIGENTLFDSKVESEGVSSFTIPLLPGYHKIKMTISNASNDGFKLQAFFLNPGDTNPNEMGFDGAYYLK